MYYWRKLTEHQQQHVLKDRREHLLPWHRPPHADFNDSCIFIITAACLNHEHVIGSSLARLGQFEADLIAACTNAAQKLYAWCVLANHYHVLVRTDQIKELRKQLAQLHGRTSRAWNVEDNSVGRKVWYNYFDRDMKSDRHFWASLNYIHNNPVHHRYVEKWQDWPYTSAHEYLAEVGHDEAERVWREYPVLDYGKGWDVY